MTSRRRRDIANCSAVLISFLYIYEFIFNLCVVNAGYRRILFTQFGYTLYCKIEVRRQTRCRNCSGSLILLVKFELYRSLANMYRTNPIDQCLCLLPTADRCAWRRTASYMR